MIGTLSRLARRFASQALLSGSVMVALHAAGGGAGLYGMVFGSADPVAQVTPAKRTVIERQARLPTPTHDDAVSQEPAFSSPKTAAIIPDEPLAATRAHREAAAENRSSGDERGRKDLSIPTGVTLFSECKKNCESHDPLLAGSTRRQGVSPPSRQRTAVHSAQRPISDRPEPRSLTAHITEPLADGFSRVSSEVGSLVDGAGSALTSAFDW